LIKVDDRQKVRLGLGFSTHACLTLQFQRWFQIKTSIFNNLLVV